MEDLFREALAEQSRVRRRNQFRKALCELHNDSVSNPRLVGYLLDGLEMFAKDPVADQIAGEYLPRFGKAVVPKLRQSLNLQGTRTDALRLTALVKIDPTAGRKLCNTALQEGSAIVRGQAMKALTELDPKTAERVALKFLSYKKMGLQFQKAALTALTSSRSDQALELLLAALPRPRLVWSAHFALEKSPHPRVSACLQAQLASRLNEIETGAAQVPGRHDRQLWHLMNLLVDRPESTGLVTVIKLMDHPVDGVRGNATSTVYHHINNHALAGKRAIPELIAALKYSDPEARDAAAIVLSRGGAAAKAAVPALAEILRTDSDFGARRRTADYLGNIGTPVKTVVAALVAALRDESSWVRRQAGESLGRLGPSARAALPELVKCLEDADENATGRIPEVLHQIGPFGVVLPTLIEALRHPHQGVRGTAANVMGDLGPRAHQAIPALIDLLSDEDGWVCWRAADALGKMGGLAKAAVPALCVLLQPLSASAYHGWCNRIRAAAVEALGKIGPAARAAIPVLTALRREKNKEMRETVAQALAAIAEAR